MIQAPGRLPMRLFARERPVLLAVPKTGTTAREAAPGARADMVLRARRSST